MRRFRNLRGRLLLERGLYLAGGLLLGTWLALHMDAQAYQARQMRELAQAGVVDDGSPAKPVPARARTAVPETVPLKSVIGQIDIPRLKLSAVVSEGTDSKTLLRAVGHLPGTALPGQAGNTVLAGHRDTYFRSLAGVTTDDTIRVNTIYGRYRYRVVSTKIIPPSRTEVLSPSPTPMLTLVTCYPFHYVGRAPLRYVVQAEELPDEDL